MNVIIFSKDRAAQLDLLLRSMFKANWFADAFIVWCASTKDYYDGYDKLFWEYWFDDNRVHLFEQHETFKTSLLEQVDDNFTYMTFLMDDNIFINEWNGFKELPDDFACLSLRLNPRMEYCYSLSRRQHPPKYVTIFQNNKRVNAWYWHAADADYGYPMSLDGHIFRTTDILPLLKKLEYNNPNQLEGQLARHPINRPKMMCFDKSVIINNPINRVQTVNNNRHGDISAEWLNEQFLQGKRIDLKPFLGYEPNACHVELPISWI